MITFGRDIDGSDTVGNGTGVIAQVALGVTALRQHPRIVRRDARVIVECRLCLFVTPNMIVQLTQVAARVQESRVTRDSGIEAG